MGVFAIASQSNTTSGFCASSTRRMSGSNGDRPTFTPGGVRNQYNTRGRPLPRLVG
jgi:hypothetical protein